MRSSPWVMIFAIPCLGAGDAPDSVAVMPLVAKRVPKETVAVLDDLLLTSVAQTGKYRPLGAGDVNAMLGVEKMKEALGCDDVSCAVEIGGALGVETLLTGTVSKLGSNVIVTLSLVDAKARAVKRRSKAQVKNDEDFYPQAIDLAVCQLLELRPDCAAAPSRAGDPSPASGAAPESPAGRGYRQYQNGRLAKSAPAMQWADAAIDCLEAHKKYEKVLTVSCDFDGKRMGYELFWDGARVGYEPSWDVEKARSNCAWNVKTYKDRVVTCRFEGGDLAMSDDPAASAKTCTLEARGGMSIGGAWKDVVNTADWKYEYGCIWRIWADPDKALTVTWTSTAAKGGVAVEIDQFPLTDNAGAWSQAVLVVNGKRFPLGPANAGLSTYRLDLTGVITSGVNRVSLHSTTDTNLLHGVQAIRIVGRP